MKSKTKLPDAHIRNARYLLFGIAAVQLYTSLTVISIVDTYHIIRQIVLIALTVALALWTRRNPLAALAVALVLWTAGIAVEMVQYEGSLFTVLLFALVFIILALGIRNAIQLKKQAN